MVSGGVYFWQKTVFNVLQNKLQNYIENLENQLSQANKINENLKQTNYSQAQKIIREIKPWETNDDNSVCIMKKNTNNDSGIELDYHPNYVQVIIEYIPDYPVKQDENPNRMTITTQNDLYKEKEFIEKAKSESECTAFLGMYGKSDNIYCQIQEHGDSRGQLEIYSSRNDAEWITVKYLFYKDDYRISISACNNAPCYALQRWNGKGELAGDEQFIDAYINNKEIKTNLYNYDTLEFESVDFKKIFDEFKKSINSIKYVNGN